MPRWGRGARVAEGGRRCAPSTSSGAVPRVPRGAVHPQPSGGAALRPAPPRREPARRAPGPQGSLPGEGRRSGGEPGRPARRAAAQ